MTPPQAQERAGRGPGGPRLTLVRDRPERLRPIGALEDRKGPPESASGWPAAVAEERRSETRVLLAIFALVAVMIVVAIAWGMASVSDDPPPADGVERVEPAGPPGSG